MSDHSISNERLYQILDELNEMSKNAGWIWKQRGFSLGSCFRRSKYLQAHILREGKTLDDVLESWKTEPLLVECKTGLHILMVYLHIEMYGKEFFENDMDKLNYTEGASNTTFFFMLPFLANMTPLPEDRLSDAIFPTPHSNKRFDYVYLRGIRAFEQRAQLFPLLTPSFQGENLVKVQDAKDGQDELYIGCWHRGSGAKYIIRKKEDICKDLRKNGKRDFCENYPQYKNLFAEKGLGELSPLGRGIVTSLSWPQHFKFNTDTGKYEIIS